MFRLLIIALLVVGVSGLALAQDKGEKGPDPKEVNKDEPKVKAETPKETPKEVTKEVYVETPHWSRRVPLDLVQVAMSVIIAALLGLAVGQLSGLKSSIDKLADKMGGGGA